MTKIMKQTAKATTVLSLILVFLVKKEWNPGVGKDRG
jgi:hypothetical protein